MSIEDIRIKPTQLEILIKSTGDSEYTTDFIGFSGKLLSLTKSNLAVYDLATESIYMHARIIDGKGYCAWVQSKFIVR